MLILIKLAEQPKAFRKASWHAITQFGAYRVWHSSRHQSTGLSRSDETGHSAISGMTIALTAMLVGNYLGGELVFTYKVEMERRMSFKYFIRASFSRIIDGKRFTVTNTINKTTLL